jgi:hypothetical protein
VPGPPNNLPREATATSLARWWLQQKFHHQDVSRPSSPTQSSVKPEDAPTTHRVVAAFEHRAGFSLPAFLTSPSFKDPLVQCVCLCLALLLRNPHDRRQPEGNAHHARETTASTTRQFCGYSTSRAASRVYTAPSAELIGCHCNNFPTLNTISRRTARRQPIFAPTRREATHSDSPIPVALASVPLAFWRIADTSDDVNSLVPNTTV